MTINGHYGEKSGFVLTNKCDFPSHMISIIIVLSDEMLQQIDEIKVYDIENQIAQYIDGTVRQINYLFFELESEEQELKVCLGKKQPYTDKVGFFPCPVCKFVQYGSRIF